MRLKVATDVFHHLLRRAAFPGIFGVAILMAALILIPARALLPIVPDRQGHEADEHEQDDECREVHDLILLSQDRSFSHRITYIGPRTHASRAR